MSPVLLFQVDHKSECVLAPMYGMLVPFHILTVKNATNNQDNEHAYIRINFNFGPSYEPGTKYPTSVFLKELSFRTSDVRHAAKVVQEIKALRSQVQLREREKAERATLVQQEKLVRSKVRSCTDMTLASLQPWRCTPLMASFPLQGRVYALPDVWIRPAFGGKGRKVAGTLEAHANGFRYTSPKGEELDIMYRFVAHTGCTPSRVRMRLRVDSRACDRIRALHSSFVVLLKCCVDCKCRNIKHAFYQPAENEMITLVHFHLLNPIMVCGYSFVQHRTRPPLPCMNHSGCRVVQVGKKKTKDVQFYSEVMDTVQTLDAGRRSMCALAGSYPDGHPACRCISFLMVPPACRYDPDEIEEEQRERERRNQINRQFSQFVKRVQQDIWERDYG